MSMKSNVSAMTGGSRMAVEVWTRLDRAVKAKGGNDEDLYQLACDEGQAKIDQIADMLVFSDIIDCDAPPLLPHEVWTVEEHKQGGRWFSWKPTKVRLYLSDSQMKRSCIEGHQLRRELAEMPVLNANVLDYLLQHPHLIPEKWKQDDQGHLLTIFFWGTIYRNFCGRLCVRCLYFASGRWQEGVYWLDMDWRAWAPAVVFAS